MDEHASTHAFDISVAADGENRDVLTEGEAGGGSAGVIWSVEDEVDMVESLEMLAQWEGRSKDKPLWANA